MQLLNTSFPSFVIEPPMAKDPRAVQLLNAASPMVVTDSGRDAERSFSHPSNAWSPMDLTLSEIMAMVRLALLRYQGV